jgi:hypothetical protein
VVLITAWGSIDLAVEGMKAGAADFVTKPWNNAQILQSVETALSLAARPWRGRPGREGRPGPPPRSSTGATTSAAGGAGPEAPAGPRAGRPGGPHGRLGPHHRRERHRQGAGRRGDPPQQPAPPGRSSRSTSAGSPRPSSRARCSATCAAPSPTPGRTARGASSGPRRHDLPRRDRRGRPGGPGQAPARPPGPLLRGAGLEHHPHGGRARGLGHQPALPSWWSGAVPGGPPLPPEPDLHPPAAAARAARGRPAPRPVLPGGGGRDLPPAGPGALPGRPRLAPGANAGRGTSGSSSRRWSGRCWCRRAAAPGRGASGPWRRSARRWEASAGARHGRRPCPAPAP